MNIILATRITINVNNRESEHILKVYNTYLFQYLEPNNNREIIIKIINNTVVTSPPIIIVSTGNLVFEIILIYITQPSNYPTI